MAAYYACLYILILGFRLLYILYPSFLFARSISIPYRTNSIYNLAFSAPSISVLLTHSPTTSTNLSTSSKLFPACKQTLTLCPPTGTVGATIARTMKPAVWHSFAKSRGSGVRSEKIGDSGQRCGMRKRRCEGGSDRARRRECRCDTSAHICAAGWMGVSKGGTKVGGNVQRQFRRLS